MRSGPTRIVAIVARLVEDTTGPASGRGAPGRRTFDVFQAFDRIGPPLTEHAEPASFRKGRLTLRVRSSAWLTELAMMQSKLVQRLNGALPRPLVEEVRLVLGSPRVRRPPPTTPSVTLTPVQQEQVAAWASTLGNETVREAFVRAATTSLASGPAAHRSFSGPPGPRVMPAAPATEDEGGEEPELSYGWGDRVVDRWVRRK